MEEAPGFIILGTAVEGHRLLRERTSSVESTAVTSIETSVFEPGKSGRTTACRQFWGWVAAFSVRGYTWTRLYDQRPEGNTVVRDTYDSVCRVGLPVNLLPLVLAICIASFVINSGRHRRRSRCPGYLLAAHKQSRNRHINIP